MSLFAVLALSSLFPLSFSSSARSSRSSANFAETAGQTSSTPPQFPSKYPFKPGEKLVYDIGFQKSVLSGNVGQLELEVKYPAASVDSMDTPFGQTIPRPAVPPGSDGTGSAEGNLPNPDSKRTASANLADDIELNGTLISKGFYTWVLGVNVQDRYQSIVSSRDLSLSKFVKITDQSNLHRQEETSIDRSEGLATYAERDPNNGSAQPKVKIVSCPPWVLDILSAFYFVRAQDFKEKQTLTIPLTDAGRVFDVDLVTGAHETVEFKSGKTIALPIDVRIFDGRYVRRSGQLTVWLSSDPSRVPVRARVKTNGMTINVVLERLPSALSAPTGHQG